jgi:hypothetical protein
MRYVLNSAVVTAFGTWEYRPITLEEATVWLREGGWRSTVRYPDTADVIRKLTGVSVPLRNEVVRMKPGDEALVFRIRFEEGGERIDAEMKGKLDPEWIERNIEIGVLRMVSATWRRS